MWIELLLLTGFLTGFTLLFGSRVRHPYAKALFSLILGTALCIPTLLDVRLVLIPVFASAVVVALSKQKLTIITAVATLLAAIVLLLTPHINELLYLQSRYDDSFTYFTDGMYYAERLEKTITVSRAYGDTYQSELYGDLIQRTVLAQLPRDAKVYSIRVEPVQTRRLFVSYNEYVEAVNPTVYVRMQVPQRVDLSRYDLPYNTTVELIK